MKVVSARVPDELHRQLEEAIEAGRFKSRSEALIHCLQVGLGRSLIDEIREVIRVELRAFKPQQAEKTAPNPKKAKLLQQTGR